VIVATLSFEVSTGDAHNGDDLARGCREHLAAEAG
jgi:hypothetical protein